MKKEKGQSDFENLPGCAADYIRLVIKKMRWRKKVRADVQAELIAHFEDALKECKTDGEKEKTAKDIIDNFGDAKLIATLARRAKKRCRPLWQKMTIKAFQTFGVIIGLFIIYLIWFLSGKPNITTDYLAELNRIVRPADANKSQNAAVYYDQVAEKIKNMPESLKDIFAKSYYECNEFERKQGQEWLAKNQGVSNLIAVGNEKPYYWQKYEAENNEMMKVLMPYSTDYRNLSRILNWEACHLAEQGDFNQAFQNLITIYKLGKHTKSDPMLIGQLVAVAIEGMAIGNLRDILYRYPIYSAELAKFDSEIQAIIQDEAFRINFEGEKLFMYDEMQRCFTVDSFGSGHIYMKRILYLVGASPEDIKDNLAGYLLFPFEALRTQSDRNTTIEKVNRLYDYYDKIADMSPAQQRLPSANFDKEDLDKIIGNNIFMKILIPAISKVIAISYRIEADVQATMTVIAAIRYKQDRGNWPNNLQQLSDKGYLKKIPIDPYSDAPLVYRKTENGFTLYSFGPDFDDDGGKTYNEAPGRKSIWPPDSNDGDAVFWPVLQNKAK